MEFNIGAISIWMGMYTRQIGKSARKWNFTFYHFVVNHHVTNDILFVRKHSVQHTSLNIRDTRERRVESGRQEYEHFAVSNIFMLSLLCCFVCAEFTIKLIIFKVFPCFAQLPEAKSFELLKGDRQFNDESCELVLLVGINLFREKIDF